MTRSQFNQSATESKELTTTQMSAGLINTILQYTGEDAIAGTTATPLVSTLFSSIKTSKIRRLLAAIVNGKRDETKVLLDENPFLVLEKLEENEFVTGLSEHKFNLKPYQAALAVDDIQMQALVKSYFKDEKEADRQKSEQEDPPREIVEAEQEKWQRIFMQLNTLTLAIAKSNSQESKEPNLTSSGKPDYIVTVKKESRVEKELFEFWKLLDATRDSVITAGRKPFNPDLLLTALKTYDDDNLFKKYFGDCWDDPRALLFWQKVIGYDGIHRIMPVNYVQAFRDGLKNTVKKLQRGELQGRSTQFEIDLSGKWVPVDYYPLRPRGTSGFNFGIDGQGQYCGLGGWSAEWLRFFADYVNQIQQLTDGAVKSLIPHV